MRAGLDAGLLRQTITFLLPVNEKEADFNSTEPVDYPCSLQKVGAAGMQHAAEHALAKGALLYGVPLGTLHASQPGELGPNMCTPLAPSVDTACWPLRQRPAPASLRYLCRSLTRPAR